MFYPWLAHAYSGHRTHILEPTYPLHGHEVSLLLSTLKLTSVVLDDRCLRPFDHHLYFRHVPHRSRLHSSWETLHCRCLWDFSPPLAQNLFLVKPHGLRCHERSFISCFLGFPVIPRVSVDVFAAPDWLLLFAGPGAVTLSSMSEPVEGFARQTNAET